MKRPEPTHWIRKIGDMIAASEGRGGFYVALHEYRPELVRAMADELGLDFADFRQEVLRPLEWEAHRFPLSGLTEFVEARSGDKGLVIHNVEALLAAKPRADRKHWFEEFVLRAWTQPIIIPITIFQVDLTTPPGRFHRVDPDDLPAETLLTRLASP